MEVHNTRWRHAVDEIGFVASARTTGNSRKYPPRWASQNHKYAATNSGREDLIISASCILTKKCNGKRMHITYMNRGVNGKRNSAPVTASKIRKTI